MKRSAYDEYIRRFNAEDATAFDDYLSPDMRMLNGALEFHGVEGMRDHYENKIWPFFVERLNVHRFVSDENTLAVQLVTQFTAKADADTIFGSVVAGEQFEFRGIVMYEIVDGRFGRITVSYNRFTNTKRDGTTTHMGIPH